MEGVPAVQLDSPLHFAHGGAADSAVLLLDDHMIRQTLELPFSESLGLCLLLCDCQILDEPNQGI